MSTSALEPCGGACRHDGVAYCLARGPSWVCTLAAGHADGIDYTSVMTWLEEQALKDR